MDDSKIVELYFKRDEKALSETKAKYHKYCHYIANSILNSNEDADECVNDTYLKAWNSIPPSKPQRLSTYLGKITRNLALNMYIASRAKKRSDKTEVILDELCEVIPDSTNDGRAQADKIALKDAINGFLASLEKNTRIIFVRRYWYLSPIKEIAKDLDLSESNVKVILHRTRNDFKVYLEKEGINV